MAAVETGTPRVGGIDMIYDELIKRLRNRRICVQSGGDLEKDFPLMKEAADAIEELEKKMLNWQATADDHWEAYQHWFQRRKPNEYQRNS